MVCTACLLLLCLTGLPLIFKDEIDALFDHDVTAPVMSADTPTASLDRIVEAAQQRYPHEFVRFFFWDKDHPNVIKLSIVPTPDAEPELSHMLTLDARTAQVLAEPKPQRGFIYVMRKLHEELFAGLPGELFLCAMGVLFVVAGVSGGVIYGPFMRKLAFGTVRMDKSRRLKWLDLHNLLGIVMLTWTPVVGATGVMNTLATPLFGLWRTQELPSLLAPYQGTPLPIQLSSVQAAFDTTRQALPDMQVISVVFPHPRFGSPRHYLLWTKGKTPLTSRLFTPVLIDAATGHLTDVHGLPWYLRTLQVSRPLYFGDYGGWPMKMIWALLDIITIVLLGSGVYLWITRRKVSFEVHLAEIERTEIESQGAR